jgi:hypothetical protein
MAARLLVRIIAQSHVNHGNHWATIDVALQDRKRFVLRLYLLVLIPQHHNACGEQEHNGNED